MFSRRLHSLRPDVGCEPALLRLDPGMERRLPAYPRGNQCPQSIVSGTLRKLSADNNLPRKGEFSEPIKSSQQKGPQSGTDDRRRQRRRRGPAEEVEGK